MSEPNPPRRPLATFLRTAQERDATPEATEPREPVPTDAAPVIDDIDPATEVVAETVPPVADDPLIEPAHVATPGTVAGTVDAPSFLGVRPRALPTPRWQWLLVAALALLLLLQSVLADRAR
ncbi:MAG: DUF3426 domain-containing protein, partial [Stenotrophomonas sp.]